MYDDYSVDDELYSEDTHWETADIESEKNGCLPVFLLPPIAVMIVGILLVFSLSGLNTPIIPDVEAAAPYAELFDTHPGLSPLFTPEIQYWGEKIMGWATQTGLDPNLIATVMQIESCGDPGARSGAGAMGLFQVMPYHFEDGENPYIPDMNALRGLGYLKKSLDTANGDFRLAFAGYNGGIGVIPLPEASWAAETVRYAYWGSGIYADALQGASVSARLDEWLGRGGASLCTQARTNQ